MQPKRDARSVLVTGGAGFIGSALIRHILHDKGFDGHVTNLDALTYAGNLQNLASVAFDPRYTFVHGDICDSDLVTRLCREHKIDTIINLAAESHVDRSIRGPEPFIQTNIVGVFRLLEVVRGVGGIHFHHVSTDEVFGSVADGARFTETTPYEPRSPYSAAKASSDHLVRAYVNTYGISATISNCCNNYGPYHFPEKLIPLIIRNCLKGEPLPVYGDGGQVRDWLYVDDHADALWLIARHGASGQSYNVGAESECTNLWLVERLCDLVAELHGDSAAKLRGLIRFVADRPGHDRRYAIDPSKIRRDLGWRHRYDLERGLRQTVAWYLDNGAWLAAVEQGTYRDWLQQHYGSK
jgi:dTDP-glucose 4,6-dehydratase